MDMVFRISINAACAYSPRADACHTATGLPSIAGSLTSQSSPFLNAPGRPWAYSGVEIKSPSAEPTAVRQAITADGAAAPSRSGLKCGSVPKWSDTRTVTPSGASAAAASSSVRFEEANRRLPGMASSSMADVLRLLASCANDLRRAAQAINCTPRKAWPRCRFGGPYARHPAGPCVAGILRLRVSDPPDGGTLCPDPSPPSFSRSARSPWRPTSRPRPTARPRIGQDSALISQLKGELRILVASQDTYLAEHAKYASSTEALGYSPMSGATVRFALAGQPDGRRHGGWTATITSSLLPELVCGVFVEDGVAPNAAVTNFRTPACWRTLPNGRMVSE